MSQMVGPQRHQVIQTSTLGSYVLSNESQMKKFLTEDNCIDIGYHLHRKKLGEGGFGKVRLATHLKTGHKVAVKIMDKKKLGDDLFRVRTEINSLKVLRHENIAKLYQVIETETEIYLILEYCSGGELFDYLVSKNRLSENETKKIMRDLCSALQFIHSNGFAHRDLKPENILFDAKHRIKLIDFGLAASCQDNNNSLNHLRTCCGSPAYAAPELLQGPHYSGPAVDVWSAGVLLFALLVGRLPFDDENIGALYKKIQSGFYRIPDFLSDDAKNLIRSMLMTNPSDRITIDRILMHPWLRCMTETTNTSIIPFMKPNLDESVFFECCRLFREVPAKQLREKILHSSGYKSATYWLIKMNGPPSTHNMGIKSPLISNVNKVERRRSRSFTHLVNNENELVSNQRQIGNELPKIPENKGFRRNLWSPKATPDSPSKIPVPLFSPKQKLKEIKSPNNSPLIPPKRARIVGELTTIESPLKTQKSCPRTPNFKIESTPKKSLLKRFLETATPAKSQTPRCLTTSTATKNITQTKFTEPQILIQKLIETLTAKGIQCKQKDFSLRCVLSTNNSIILSFSLEICKFNNSCVIQRKRLKGDAWNYKRVCEEILRISNE